MTRSSPRHPTERPGRLRTVAVAVASALAGSAWANPSGPSVAAGAASFSTSGNTLSITNAPGTIINWQQFSIRPDEVTRFIQSGAASAVLNRVTGAEHSQLLGQLLSNGRVFLINPAGITIGAGATIDTAGFVASSLNISDADFLSGRMRFQALGGDPGKVVNQGSINAHSGGSIYLIAPTVENHGVTTAPNGDVLLAAGRSVEVVATASPHIRVEINAPSGGEAVNVGEVVAGRIGIYGGLVRNGGTLNATTATVGENGNIILKASGDVRLAGGTVKAAAADGGAIRIEGDRVVQGAAIDASGAQGGTVSIQANTVVQGARIDARGAAGKGGSIAVQSAGSLVQTADTVLDASGTTAGGSVTVQGTGERRVFTSATMKAASSSGAGGAIKVLGDDIVLSGAKLDASGDAGGGRVLVGGDFRGANPDVPNAQFVKVTGGSTIAADAKVSGNGGDVVVWADRTASFGGTITARGGSAAGDGGRVEISGKEAVRITGHVDASAPNGTAGSLLIDPKNIIIAATAPTGSPAFELNDPNPAAGENFGASYEVIAGKWAVAADPNDQGGFGAAYVFDVDATSPNFATLRSTILGAAAGDQVGSGGVTPLTGTASFIVSSPQFGGGAGALTFGTTGAFAAGGGTVGAANSLVGGTSTANVGAARVDELVSGTRFVLVNPAWEGGRGAVTFGDAIQGMPVGVLSAANSVVGLIAGDAVGSDGLTSVGPTLNEAVLINSPSWNAATGAVSYVSMTAPISTPGAGIIDPIAGTFGDPAALPSVIGLAPGDAVGSGGVTRLSNGNAVISSPDWGGSAGASTWLNGANGFITGGAAAGGTVTAANSLTGLAPGDFANQTVTPLANGNYVLLSPAINNNGGAVTLVAGAAGGGGQPIVNGSTQGVTTIGSVNSLLGGGGPGALADAVVQEILDPLAPANSGYVVLAPSWNGNVGAVTFARSGGPTAGPLGGIGPGNSLVGTVAGDRVGDGTADRSLVVLSGGWYAVQSPEWRNLGNTAAGAVTFFNAANAPTRLVGAVSAANSLVGSSPLDRIGTYACDGRCSGITDMLNGTFVVASPNWSNGAEPNAGAVTLVDPVGGSNTGPRSDGTGVAGVVNSLYGTTAGDTVGGSALTFGGGVLRLDADRFAISSPDWDNGAAANAGALTFGSVSAWVPGPVSAANSLYGTASGDRIGSDGLFVLPSFATPTYALASSRWNGDAGAVTFFDTTSLPLGQAVSGTNSAVGTTPGDVVGGNGVVDVGAGKAVILSPNWGGGLGAATVVDVAAARSGLVVSATNSFTGAATGDAVGIDVHTLTNGNFVVRSDVLGAGGLTFMTPTATRAGETLSTANTLVGADATYRQLGFDFRELASGDYIVVNPAYGANTEGMIVFGSGTTGVAGNPSVSNGWLGTQPGEQLGAKVQLLAGNQFVFNAPGAAKGALPGAGQLFVANPAGLGGGVVFTGTMPYTAYPGSDVTISAAQIASILNAGTQVLLQASNDITVDAAILANNTSAAAGSLTMQAGRSILVNQDVINRNVDGASGRSIVLQANDPAAIGPRDAGLGQLRVAAGRQIVGTGDVLLEVLDGTGAGTAGGMTVGSVSGANVEFYNSALPSGAFDANRSIDLAPGSVINATQRFALVADGDARFGTPGGAGARVQGMTLGVDVVAFGNLVGGNGTLIDAGTASLATNLSAQSIGAPAQPFGLVHGPQGVDAVATTGGIHLAQNAALTDASFFSFDAPAAQAVSLGALGGGMNVAAAWNVNGNPLRLYTGGGDITFTNPLATIASSQLQLDAGAGAIVVPGGVTLNGPLQATSRVLLQGGTTTLNGAATLLDLRVTGNGTILDIGGGPVTATTLGWGTPGTPEGNVITGTGGTLTVAGGATISGDGTRTLTSVALNLGGGSSSQYTAGTGAFNMLGTASITNNGVFTLNNDNAFASPATALNAFTNNGTLTKAAGTGTTTIGGPVGQVAFTNTGSVQVASGRIALASGSTLNGTINLAAGAGLDLVGGVHGGAGSVAGPGTLTLANATLNANGAIGAAATQVNTGGVLNANGALTGQLAVAGGTANVNGTANTTGVDLAAGQLNIGGSMVTQTWNQSGGTAGGPGDLAIQQSYARLAGAFGGFDDLAINQASGSLDATGLGAVSSIALAAPTGTLTVGTPLAVSGLAKLAGTNVALNANVTAGTIELVGPNVQLGSVTLTGSLNGAGASVVVPDGAAVTFSGGGATLRDLTVGANGTTLTLSGPTDVLNGFLWQGGTGISTIAGAGVPFVVAGNAAIGGDGTHVLDGVQMTNVGSMIFGPTFGAGGPLLIQNGALLANSGLFDIQNDQPIRSDAGTGTLRNLGGMVKSGAGGSTVLGGGAGTFVFDNQGSVRIDSGRLVITESGTQSGTFTLGPAGGLEFANGTHTLTGSISGGTLGVSGTANVTIAGTLSANLMDISGGVLDIDGAAATNLYNQSGGIVGGTGDLSVASSFSQTGGTFGNTFNALSVTQASGDINGAGFGAVGLLALAAPTGAVNISTPLTLSGAANFFGGTGINVSAPVTAASVGMVTGGTARISNATVQATSGAISVAAGQVEVIAGSAPAGLIAAAGLSVVSSGDVVVQGGAGAGAHAELNAGTGPLAMSVQRDLKILGGAGDGAYALVIGDPDVGSRAAPVKVGGAITMQEGTGAGATARIESVSATSIYVLFPNLATGGYTVNGQEVTALNGSGFYAGSAPAILDANLFIDYGLTSVQQFDPGVLVTALNQATQPLGETNDEEGRSDLQRLFDDIDDAPVCK